MYFEIVINSNLFSAYQITTCILIGATLVATGVDIWASVKFQQATEQVLVQFIIITDVTLKYSPFLILAVVACERRSEETTESS